MSGENQVSEEGQSSKSYASKSQLAEHHKLRSQIQVLKRAYVSEKRRSDELLSELKDRERQIHKLNQDVDGLDFNNQRLTKRCAKLVRSLREHDTSIPRALSPNGGLGEQDGKTSGWGVGKILNLGSTSSGIPKAEAERLQSDLRIAQDELSLKIQENEKLHMEIFEAKEEHRNIVEVLQNKLSDIKTSLREKQSQVESLEQNLASTKQSLDRIQEETSKESQALRDELTDIRKQSETKLHDLRSQISSLEIESRRLTQRLFTQAPFEDTFDSNLTEWNLSPYDSNFLEQRKQLYTNLLTYAKYVHEIFGNICAAFATSLEERTPDLQQDMSKVKQHHQTLVESLAHFSVQVQNNLHDAVQLFEAEAQRSETAVEFQQDDKTLRSILYEIVQILTDFVSLHLDDVEDQLDVIILSGKSSETTFLQSHMARLLESYRGLHDSLASSSAAAGTERNDLQDPVLMWWSRRSLPWSNLKELDAFLDYLVQIRSNLTSLSSRYAVCATLEGGLTMSSTNTIVSGIGTLSTRTTHLYDCLTGFRRSLVLRKVPYLNTIPQYQQSLRNLRSKAQGYLQSIRDLPQPDHVSYEQAREAGTIISNLRQQVIQYEERVEQTKKANDRSEKVRTDLQAIVQEQRGTLEEQMREILELKQQMKSIHANRIVEEKSKVSKESTIDTRGDRYEYSQLVWNSLSEDSGRLLDLIQEAPESELNGVLKQMQDQLEEVTESSCSPNREIESREITQPSTEVAGESFYQLHFRGVGAAKLFQQRMEAVRVRGLARENAKYRQELRNREEAAISLELEQERLRARCLDETSRARHAKEKATNYVGDVERLQLELAATRQNYEHMVEKLTERICELTDSLARHDAA